MTRYCKDCGTEIISDPITNRKYCPNCDKKWTAEKHVDLIKDLLDRVKRLEKEVGINGF